MDNTITTKKNKQWIAVLLLLLCTAVECASDFDSLKCRLLWVKADIRRVWLLRDIAYFHQSDNPDSVIYYGNRDYDNCFETDKKKTRIRFSHINLRETLSLAIKKKKHLCAL